MAAATMASPAPLTSTLESASYMSTSSARWAFLQVACEGNCIDTATLAVDEVLLFDRLVFGALFCLFFQGAFSPKVRRRLLSSLSNKPGFDFEVRTLFLWAFSSIILWGDCWVKNRPDFGSKTRLLFILAFRSGLMGEVDCANCAGGKNKPTSTAFAVHALAGVEC